MDMDNPARAAATPSGKYGGMQPKLPVRLLCQVRALSRSTSPRIANCWPAINQLPGLNNGVLPPQGSGTRQFFDSAEYALQDGAALAPQPVEMLPVKRGVHAFKAPGVSRLALSS